MKKLNLIVSFADWYIETKEGESANYLAHSFRNDRDYFIASLSEYAVEFAMAYGYNPFKADKEKLDALKADLEKKGTSFDKFSESQSTHVPRAILGKNNYLQFLTERYAEKKNTESLKEPVIRNQAANAYHYEQDELRKNFYLRLITQDRLYEFLYFPISVLKKLFYYCERAEFFDNWINKQIDNIIVYTGNSDKSLFKDIKTLDIKEDGSVVIDGNLKLYTSVAGTNAKEEINTNTLENIEIDHVVPLSDVLFELKGELPALRIIHNIIENIRDGERISNRKSLNSVGNYLVSNVEFTTKELDDLEADLNKILNKIQLQLMDKYENRYKK
jgi:hypothetical protein